MLSAQRYAISRSRQIAQPSTLRLCFFPHFVALSLVSFLTGGPLPCLLPSPLGLSDSTRAQKRPLRAENAPKAGLRCGLRSKKCHRMPFLCPRRITLLSTLRFCASFRPNPARKGRIKADRAGFFPFPAPISRNSRVFIIFAAIKLRRTRYLLSPAGPLYRLGGEMVDTRDLSI